MTTNITTRVTTAILAAVVIAIVAIVIPKFIFSGILQKIMTTQGLELFLSLLAIVIFGKSRFSEYGFCRPRANQQSAESKNRWVLISLSGLLLGMAATLVMLAFGGSGNPLVKSLSFPQIVLFVWILSSTIEEVFTRGFLQGHLSVLSGRYFRLFFIRIELPVLISALFFACMHLVLLLSGVNAGTITVTLLFTFSLGLIAGHLRAKTGSLIPAIAVHFLANVGGVIGGIIFAIIHFMITGELPTI